jgi:hypothetical protein
MNKRCDMSMPGYTAEASLYQTNTRYQMVRVGAQTKGTISPAQMMRLGVPSAGFGIREFLCEAQGCYWSPWIGCWCIH